MSTALKGLGVILLGLAVIGIWGVSALANFAHALQLAGTSEWNYVMAGASAASDVLKAAAILAIIAAVRRRYWGAALAACLIWIACSTWSIRSGVGFVATTIADTKVERTFKASTDQSLKAELEQLPKTIGLLREQIVRAGSTNARVSLQTEIERAEARLDELRTRIDTRPAAAAVDPLGDLLATHFDVDRKTTELATVLMFLALIELGSNLGLVAFSHLLRWPPQVWDVPPTQRSAVELRADGEEPRPALVVQNSHNPYDHLAEFVAELKKDQKGDRVWVNELHAKYERWSQERQVPAITTLSMPMTLRTMGIERKVDPHTKKHFYVLPKEAA